MDREGGAFYQRGWESLLARHPAVRPRLVMVETWNELHEGTEVAPTAEHGYRYVHLTRQYADLWRSGVYRPPTGHRGPRGLVAATGEPRHKSATLPMVR